MMGRTSLRAPFLPVKLALECGCSSFLPGPWREGGMKQRREAVVAAAALPGAARSLKTYPCSRIPKP